MSVFVVAILIALTEGFKYDGKGRRRMARMVDADAAADGELCHLVNTFVHNGRLRDLDANELEKLTLSVENWCSEHFANGESDEEAEWNNFDASVARVAPHLFFNRTEARYGTAGYTDRVESFDPALMVERRRAGAPLPSSAWRQCVGYAYAARLMLKGSPESQEIATRALASFLTDGESSPTKRCGSSVNSVNAYARSPVNDDVSVVEHEGREIVVVKDPQIAKLLGLPSLAILATTVYKLMDLCQSYAAIA